jgi:hypothetical protein
VICEDSPVSGESCGLLAGSISTGVGLAIVPTVPPCAGLFVVLCLTGTEGVKSFLGIPAGVMPSGVAVLAVNLTGHG